MKFKEENSLYNWCINNDCQYLLEEWDYSKNGKLNPKNVSRASNKIIWWKCKKCGFEWSASLNNRASKRNRTMCPNCSIAYRTSIPEKICSFYLKRIFPDLVENYTSPLIENMELDIYIPSRKIGIEFDGEAWHQNKERDLKKDLLCKNNGILLLRIREEGLPILNSSSIVINTKRAKGNYEALEKPLKEIETILSNTLNQQVDLKVNIQSDYDNIMGQINCLAIEKSVAKTKLVNEWDYKKNKIDPHYVSASSNKLAWWICSLGHSWKACVNDRNRGAKCPVCSNKKLLIGYNDLETKNPKLAKEFDLAKNGIKPSQILFGSNKRVWWLCSSGHSWSQKVMQRNNRGDGCPFCSNKKVQKGFNDLATTDYEALEEWDFQRNIIKPTEVTSGSNKIAWWVCSECGNSYQRSVYNKIHLKYGCKKCVSKKRSQKMSKPDFGKSFGDLYPDLIKDWDYSRNDKTPFDYKPKSNFEVYWKCHICGYKYKKTICNKVLKSQCYRCKGSEERVLCIETGEKYWTIAEAAAATGCLASKVSMVLNGQRKTTNNKHFKYVKCED